MKDFVKYAAVGIAGYLVGFYEMKYKLVKSIAESSLKKDLEVKKEEEEES